MARRRAGSNLALDSNGYVAFLQNQRQPLPRNSTLLNTSPKDGKMLNPEAYTEILANPWLSSFQREFFTRRMREQGKQVVGRSARQDSISTMQWELLFLDGQAVQRFSPKG